MQELESKELILKVTGEVQASNINEFNEKALAYIADINTNLVTDQDFAEAKQITKSCKIIEDRIENALQAAVMSMETVAEVRRIAGKLQIKLRETRLDLDKKVKSEEAKRKSEITSGAIERVNKHLKNSKVQHAFSVDSIAINGAIKNKRSLAKMQEAVDEAAVSQIFAIDELETLYLKNLATIQKTDKEYPGLFPDYKRIAISPTEVVEAQIDARVNKFKFDQQEKERKEKEAAEIKAKKEAEEKRLVETATKMTEAPVFNEPPVFGEPPSFNDEDKGLSENELHKAMNEHFSSPRKKVINAAKRWFCENFDSDTLRQMELHGIIKQAEGYRMGMIATLEQEIEEAFESV